MIIKAEEFQRLQSWIEHVEQIRAHNKTHVCIRIKKDKLCHGLNMWNIAIM